MSPHSSNRRINLLDYGALPSEEGRVDSLLRSGIFPRDIAAILQKDRALNALMGPVWARRQQLLGKTAAEVDNIIHAEFPNLREELEKIRVAA